MPVRFINRLLAASMLVAALGCAPRYRDDLDYSYRVEQTWRFESLSGEIAQFESVAWDPGQLSHLRRMIESDSIAAGRSVLVIGAGVGLVAILCNRDNAAEVIATDTRPAAIANARYNAAVAAPDAKLDFRLADGPQAFAAVAENERFDLILCELPQVSPSAVEPSGSNPSTDQPIFVETLLDGLMVHLKPGGRCLIAIRNRRTGERVRDAVEARGFQLKLVDDRDLEQIDDVLYPSVVMEVRVPIELLPRIKSRS